MASTVKTTADEKEREVARLCADEVLRNVAVRSVGAYPGVPALDGRVVEQMTREGSATPSPAFVEAAAKYYTNKRGKQSFRYSDAPALALLRLRAAMLQRMEDSQAAREAA